jgi:exodeoxyribonuclease VIII
MSIQSRMPRDEYDRIPALNITRLKEMRRSPQHYRYRLETPKESAPMTLGLATHVAVLEPERFAKSYAVWTNRTDAGAMSPRRGKVWEEFCALNASRSIITADEERSAQDIAVAVRFNENAMRYLASGDSEVTMQWDVQGRPAKGRIDWFTMVDGEPTIVGLKTARDCRHFQFGAQCAKLGYHLQFAFYSDGYYEITSKIPKMVEIVVESEAPHAVAVYRIPNDVIEQGREEYAKLLEDLANCEEADEWPGPQLAEEDLTLPSWAYERGEDISDLGLEWTT